jgi:hypothetical protein
VTVKSDDELNRMLGNLQLAEFIYEQPAVGDLEYSFVHALTQEVAYNSVLMDGAGPLTSAPPTLSRQFLRIGSRTTSASSLVTTFLPPTL